MQRLVQFAVIGSVVFAGACSNGPRNGFDTMGAGATPGEAGGAPRPEMSAAGSVAPTTSTTTPATTTADTSKHGASTAATTAKKTEATRKKP